MESDSKSTSRRSTGIELEEEAEKKTPKKRKVTVSEPQYKAISLIPAKVQIKDAPSGKLYIFPKAGSEVKVELADVEHLRNKKQTRRPCCGAGGSNLAFELVEV